MGSAVSTQSLVSKFGTIRTIKWIYQSVPSTSVADLNNLSIGAHIKLNQSREHTGHAIVSQIDTKKRKLSIIKCECKDINTPASKAEITEETLQFHEVHDVFLVNYKNKYMDHVMPHFKRIPHEESVKVAQYFKDNHVSFGPELMKDCEHFALCCTMGYPINFQEMNLLLIAFGALEMFDKGTFSKLKDHVKSKQRVSYNESGHLTTITLQPNEQITLS